MNEMFALDDAQAAYERMMSGKTRFRVVLKVGEASRVPLVPGSGGASPP